MTATPRIYAPHITKKAKENDVLICSMDDNAAYGKPFYEMTFGEAIARGHITDYKIVVICVTDSEVREVIQQGGRVFTDDGQEWDAEALAKRIALVKGINEYGLKKIFTFHSRVKGAQSFTDTKIPYGIHQIFNMLSPNVKKDVAGFFHVNGTMSAGERSSYMREFKKTELAIMSNARCLTEGVDVPAVDTVAFIDPKKSLIDIVQATGRAMRNAEWKKTGYVFIPVVVEDSPDLEKFIESSDFNTVWQVLQAMMDQDQRLEDIVSHLKIMQGKGDEGTQAWNDAMNEYSEKVEIYNLPTGINQARFINTLQTRTLEVIGKQWDFWYGLTLKYREQTGDTNAPHDYRTPEGFNLGSWQNHQRGNYKKGILSANRIKLLEEIGFVWDKFIAAFEEGFHATLRHKEQTGDANALQEYKTFEGFNLGEWQSKQRIEYKANRLSTLRIKRLEEIGFVWDKHYEFFKKGFQETLIYKSQTGNATAPDKYKTSDGFSLGSWQGTIRGNYRQGKLSEDKFNKLNELGFLWDIYDEIFEKGFKETLRYKEQTDNANAPRRYKMPNGYALGIWQTNKRKNYKNGKLDTEKIRRLEEIGFKWAQLEEAFEKGFQETLRYKEQTGNANAPDTYVSPNAYKLGTWQTNKRKSYKNGKLDTEKIRRLEEIGFKWAQLEEAFEKGFQETLRYKGQTGDANTPYGYTTPNGYKLGGWQSNQRNNYENGKLPPERIKRLEEIGFKWAIVKESFEKGLQESLKYKKQTGNVNAPTGYKTLDGYNLYSWQSNQRQYYKTGKLQTERIKRLDEIGFAWYPLEEAFEKGFQETLKYKEQTGGAIAPNAYKTSDGYNLGTWQATQRAHYKKSKLSPERIKRLEEGGFKWELNKK